MHKKIFAVSALALAVAACSKVPAGNVGVKVYLLGQSKGVDSEELGPGRYWIGWNEDLYLFPTFTQNYVWTMDSTEGSPNDESITFQTREGMEVNADIGISYRVDPTKVNFVFQKYRKGIDEITDIYLRNMVRDALVAESSKLPVESVYGSGKADLLAAVEDKVKEQTEHIGIIIERIYFIGSLRLPEQVTKALNMKIQATQMAEQRRNEVAQAEAEADKIRAAAKGEADAKITQATAEAQKIQMLGESLRKNPEVIRLMGVEKWDGTLPRVISGDSDFMMLLSDESKRKE